MADTQKPKLSFYANLANMTANLDFAHRRQGGKTRKAGKMPVEMKKALNNQGFFWNLVGVT